MTPGEYPDILRAVGRLLDQSRARSFDVTNQGPFITIAWLGADRESREQHCEDRDLTELRKIAKQARTGAVADSRGGYAELLRTLGQDLAVQRADFTQITQRADEFVVSGSIGGKYARIVYRKTDLLSSSRRRQGLRGSKSEPSGSMPGASGLDRSRRAPAPTDNGPLSRRINS